MYGQDLISPDYRQVFPLSSEPNSWIDYVQAIMWTFIYISVFRLICHVCMTSEPCKRWATARISTGLKIRLTDSLGGSHVFAVIPRLSMDLKVWPTFEWTSFIFMCSAPSAPLPPIFNLPKSQLQLYGESVYCIGEDMLSRCANGKNALERFTSVVAWNISTARPGIFGLAPFNPILGETHHVSRGSLNVLLEQVSHHPPVTALHATDENANVELIWSQNPVPKFYGTSVDVVVHGKKQLNLLNFGENYEMNTPRLLIRFFPVPGVDWVGNVRIRCKESGLEADLCYKGYSFLGFRSSSRSVKGRIFDSSSSVTIYDIDGHWDRIITMKDVQSGKLTVLYDAKGAISILKTPKLQDQKGLLSSESTLVWSEVSQAVVKKEWEKAREAKRAIEENERKLDRERKAEGDSWVPKHFKVAHTEDGWECNPKQKSVPSAPIIVEI